MATGDLRDPTPLKAACRDVRTVIATASAMPFAHVPEANDISTVDHDVPLVNAKRAVKHVEVEVLEAQLARAGDPIDPGAPLNTFPRPLTSMRDYDRRVLGVPEGDRRSTVETISE